MSDVDTSVGLTLANVIDDVLINKGKAEILAQIKQIDAALQEVDQKRNELIAMRLKMEGAAGYADHLLGVMAAPPATAEVPAPTAAKPTEDDGA